MWRHAVCGHPTPLLPQETPLAALCAATGGQLPQLFRSDHIEDRVSLAQVQRRCTVALGPAAAAACAAGSGDAAGSTADSCPACACLAQLSHEQMVLGALPPGCRQLPGRMPSAAVSPLLNLQAD